MLPVLKAAIAANDAQHERLKDYAPNQQHILQYLRDFRTIRLDLGQRTGKSSAICELATQNDLVIARNEGEARTNYPYCSAKIITVAQLDSGAVQKMNPDNVWVENVTYTSMSISFMYRQLARSIHQRFILLG